MTNERLETLLLTVREILRDEDTDSDARCRLASNLITLLGPEEGDPDRAPEFAARSEKPAPASTDAPRTSGGKRHRGKKRTRPTPTTSNDASATKLDAAIAGLQKMGGVASVGALADSLGIPASDRDERKRLAIRLGHATKAGRLTKVERGTYAIA